MAEESISQPECPICLHINELRQNLNVLDKQLRRSAAQEWQRSGQKAVEDGIAASLAEVASNMRKLMGEKDQAGKLKFAKMRKLIGQKAGLVMDSQGNDLSANKKVKSSPEYQALEAERVLVIRQQDYLHKERSELRLHLERSTDEGRQYIQMKKEVAQLERSHPRCVACRILFGDYHLERAAERYGKDGICGSCAYFKKKFGDKWFASNIVDGRVEESPITEGENAADTRG